jgi:AraC-like DNA-binding protein
MILKDDRSEIVPYNFPGFPVHAREYWLSGYPNMTAASHWHDDVEFVIAEEGAMSCFVDGADYPLKQGQGIFVNSRRMHFGHSLGGADCRFLCIVMSPELLGSCERIWNGLVLPVCNNGDFSHLLLCGGAAWQRGVMEGLRRIYTLCREQSAGFELEAVSLFFSLWRNIHVHAREKSGTEESAPDGRLETLRQMLGFVQRNYRQKISLEEIAQAGSVCKSNCCKIFKSVLHETPGAYLLSYRLEKSIDLLENEALSITEVAMLCGFSGASYYTEIFRREMGCTPTEYKKRHPQRAQDSNND